jgi:putative acetyltransferase
VREAIEASLPPATDTGAPQEPNRWRGGAACTYPPDVPTAPPRLAIRRQLPNATDQAVVRDLTVRAFGPDEGPVVARLVQALQSSDAFAGLSFIAEHDGRPVGHTMLTRSWVDAPAALVDVLVLSPLSVAPEHQRAGVGRALVEHALAVADDDGWPAVFLEGDPAYYSRLGFKRASARGFTSPSARIPDAAFQVVTRTAHQPWMTGALVYADRFWALDCVGLR